MADEKTKVTVVDQPSTGIGQDEAEVIIIHEVNEAESRFANLWRRGAKRVFYIVAVIFALLIGYVIGRWQFDGQSSGTVSQTVAVTPEMQVRLAGLDLANEIRKFLLEWGSAENQRSQSVLQQMALASTQAEEAQIWQRFDAASAASMQNLLSLYDAKFHQRITSWQTEFLALSADSESKPQLRKLSEHPESHIDVRKAMEDLQKLSESLATQ